MASRMWRLEEFQYDWGIPGREVDVFDEGNEDPDDMDSWRSAVRRFRQTGKWFGRWMTCAECGCVLLPDSVAERCHDHTTAAEPESRR
mgnify:CR=1 FL=1